MRLINFGAINSESGSEGLERVKKGVQTHPLILSFEFNEIMQHFQAVERHLEFNHMKADDFWKFYPNQNPSWRKVNIGPNE